jgi:hypothetical protein
MEVLFVRAKMVGDLKDSTLQDRNLHFGRTGITFGPCVVCDYASFEFWNQRHA